MQIKLALAVILLSLMNTGIVMAEIMSSEEIQIPGMIEGNGTHFEINNSEYLNITLDSSEPINLSLESAPEMVTMVIDSVSNASSVTITINGFMPLTTYHKYEDDYHNHTAFTTDENGKYTYTQDISKQHLIFIQTRPSTKFIRDDATGGDCTLIGTWDIITKTCTLTQDVYETIQIDSNGITLDGNGHSLIGKLSGYGVYLYGKSGVTIKSLTIDHFSSGIRLYSGANYNNIHNNTIIRNNVAGIYSQSSHVNKIFSNILNENSLIGINLWSSWDNTISDNFVNSTDYISWGIKLYGASQNSISKNTVFDNYRGIDIMSSNWNQILSNTVKSNRNAGILIESRSNINTIAYNNIESNYYGIVNRYDSKWNKFYNNNLINNLNQISSNGDNIYNLDAPIGGNYWSNYNEPAEGCIDTNNDNFCDEPFVFSSGQDNLPKIRPYGWQDTTPPTTSTTFNGFYGINGWYISDVLATLTSTDNESGSGVKNTEYSFDEITWYQYNDSFIISSEGTTTIYFHSTDKSGNIEQIKNQSVNIDKTPPIITGSATSAPNANNWYNEDVTVRFTASDEVSGIETSTPDTIISTEGINQYVTGTSTDVAGNTASTIVSGINIDKTLPTVSITTPANDGIYILNQALTADWSASDALSGLEDTTGNVPTGEAIDASSVGAKTFSVTAMDIAGNSVTQTVSYIIAYDFLGILPPVKQDGSSVFKSGSTIPVKFRIADVNGNYVSTAIANVTYQFITNEILGTVMEPESTAAATEGNTFRYDSTDNLYIFNLGTNGMEAGTYQLNINLDDGTVKTVQVSLK